MDVIFVLISKSLWPGGQWSLWPGGQWSTSRYRSAARWLRTTVLHD